MNHIKNVTVIGGLAYSIINSMLFIVCFFHNEIQVLFTIIATIISFLLYYAICYRRYRMCSKMNNQFNTKSRAVRDAVIMVIPIVTNVVFIHEQYINPCILVMFIYGIIPFLHSSKMLQGREPELTNNKFVRILVVSLVSIVSIYSLISGVKEIIDMVNN